ncbi:MAG: hypothetical protein K0R25_1264 [Rickettsiaceae bacterium]|jgi:hypothetical protein|nr:hypothetical protein [Rickettsiaceae bacterium]
MKPETRNMTSLSVVAMLLSRIEKREEITDILDENEEMITLDIICFIASNAVGKGRKDIMELLLNRYSNDIILSNVADILSSAAKDGHKDIVEMLLEKYKNNLAPDHIDDAFRNAVRYIHKDIVELLFKEYGDKINPEITNEVFSFLNPFASDMIVLFLDKCKKEVVDAKCKEVLEVIEKFPMSIPMNDAAIVIIAHHTLHNPSIEINPAIQALITPDAQKKIDHLQKMMREGLFISEAIKHMETTRSLADYVHSAKDTLKNTGLPEVIKNHSLTFLTKENQGFVEEVLKNMRSPLYHPQSKVVYEERKDEEETKDEQVLSLQSPGTIATSPSVSAVANDARTVSRESDR